MATPFFSGSIPDSPKSDEGLTAFELYHRMMIAYPAYTVECIETELSWRQVGALLKCWGSEPPLCSRIARVERMLEMKFGMKPISTAPQNTDKMIRQFESRGWMI